MEGPRPPIGKEIDQLVEFLDKELRPNEQWSIKNEYPSVFENQNSGNIRIITEGQEVLSHAVMKPMIVKSPVGLFKIAGIGSVVTSTTHRGKGLSTKNLEACLDAGQKHGCDFAILWTDLYDFYRRLGFELAGSELTFELNKNINFPSVENVKIIEGSNISAESMQRVYNKHTVQTLRNSEDLKKGLKIPNSKIYTAWSPTNELLAYAVEGKGADLDSYIHEWGGNVSHLLHLVNHMIKTQGRTLHIIVPSHSKNLIQNLQKLGCKSHLGFLGMIKILNPTNLFKKIKKYSRAMGYPEFILEYQNGKFFFGSEAEVFMTDSSADICRLIFGPSKASEIHEFDDLTKEVLENVLPIPMWIWGWDSI